MTDPRTKRTASMNVVLVAVVLVTCLPASLVVAGPLRSNGSPALLVGLFLFAFAAVLTVYRVRGSEFVGPVKRDPREVAGLVFFAFVATAMFLDSHAASRLLTEDESGGMVRNFLLFCSMAGLGIAIVLCVRTASDLRAIVAVLVVGVALSSAVALVQYAAGWDLFSQIRLPGLDLRYEPGLELRGGFTRVFGTAQHPIEFGVIVAASVPFALYLASSAPSRRSRTWWSVAAVLCVIAVPLAVSRSGVLAIAVSLVVYSIVWTTRQRVQALILAVIGLAFYRVVQPGLLGTIRGLFTNASTDSSVTARTDDYPQIYRLIGENVWFGLGPGTFRPQQYFFLDNQWLGTLVEGGLVGLAALILLLLAGVMFAQRARAVAGSDELRHLAQAAVASILALAASAATFDLLSFQQVSLILALNVGVAASCWYVAEGSARARADRPVDLPERVSR